MKKGLIAGVMVIGLVAAHAFAETPTAAQLQAQIQELLRQIAALQTRLAQVSAGIPGGASATATSSTPGPTMTIDTWSYVAGDPTKQHCIPGSVTIDGSLLCQTAQATGAGMMVFNRTDGLSDIAIKDSVSGKFLIVNDGSAVGPDASLRCFADAPGTCVPAVNGPLAMPLTMTLPVLSASDVKFAPPVTVTKQGLTTMSFKNFYVNSVDPNTCAATAVQGTIGQSVKNYILDSFDFGGDIGVKHNVLVIEAVSGYKPGATDPWAAVRFERYLFVQGLGNLREEGWGNDACNAGLAGCDGTYPVPAPGVSTWSIARSPGIAPYQYCAPGATGAKVISQNIPSFMTAGKSYAVTVAVQNTGAAVWTTAKNYKLGSQNPQDNSRWGLSRVQLGSSDAVAPGQTKTFTFNVTAPAIPGAYTMAWKMLREGATWFGDTASQAVEVTSDGSSVPPDPGMGGRPTITSLSSKGYGPDQLVAGWPGYIVGTGFLSTNIVSIGGRGISAPSADGRNITFTVPSLPSGTVYPLTVSNANGVSVPEASVIFQPPTSTPPAPTSTVPTSTPNRAPVGYHDVLSCAVIQGWTCDPDSTASSLTVNFYMDKPFGSGGTLVGRTVANLVREPAVGGRCGGNSAHGFSYATPSQVQNGKSHQVYAYGVDHETGEMTLLAASPKMITCQGATATSAIAGETNQLANTLSSIGTLIQKLGNLLGL